MKRRAKTGEKRDVRLPLKIDKLPTPVHEQIQKLRAQGKTWLEIEDLSKDFVKWDELPTDVLELFPHLRLPHTNLHRWYDLRVDQVQREVLMETERARVFADAFAKRQFSGIDEAIVNAIRDQVFSLLNSGAGELDREKFLAALGDFSLALTRITRVQVARKRLKLDEDKIEIGRQKLDLMKKKLGTLKEEVAKKELSPTQLQTRIDELYGIA